METFMYGSGNISGPAKARSFTARRGLLACGILSSLIYVVTDLLASTRWETYSYASQTVSELIAVDAPTRHLVLPLMVVYSLLIYAFGWGIWRSAGKRRALRVAAILIVAKEIFGLVGAIFFPIHLRGVESTISDIMHGVVTFVGVLLCMFPAMGFGAAAFGKKFRLYSIGTMLAFLIFGILAGSNQPSYVANLPTPWMGVWERINIYGYMLWIAVFAVAIIRTPLKSSQNHSVIK
jgi:hypothetical protein